MCEISRTVQGETRTRSGKKVAGRRVAYADAEKQDIASPQTGASLPPARKSTLLCRFICSRNVRYATPVGWRESAHKNHLATNPLFDESIPFRLFGAQHGLIIVLTILASVLLPVLANRYLTIRQRLQLSHIFAVAMSLSVVGWVAIEVAVGEFEVQEDLPLNVCNSAALLAPVLMWKPTLRMHEVLYFTVLAGTLQAVLTPDLPYGFPHYGFLRYWVVHSGLVAYVIYVTWSLKLFPDIRGLFRAFGWLNLYAAVMFVLNLVIGSNYMYLMRKPDTPSLLDMFGPWPWYILVCEFAALVIFVIVWLPIALRSRLAATRD